MEETSKSFIPRFLTNFNRAKKSGTCIACNKTVQWAKDRLAAHKRTSCPAVTDMEKKLFAKRKCPSPTDFDFDSFAFSTQFITGQPRDGQSSKSSAEIDAKLATFFFRTGTSLQLADSAAFKELVTALNPAYAAAMPSAKSLASSRLDEQHAKTSAALKKLLAAADDLTLLSDGWSNRRGDFTVTFSVKRPGHKPLFLSSLDCSSIAHDEAECAAAVIGVLDGVGAKKFRAFLSDHAPVMRGARVIIEERFPHIVAYGCAASGVENALRDVLALPRNAEVLESAAKIAKFVKSHREVRAKVEERCERAGVACSLSLPVEAKVAGVYGALASLQRLKDVLAQLVDEEHRQLREIQPNAAVLSLIKTHTFWDRLEQLLRDIELPTNALKELAAEDAPLALAYRLFGEIFRGLAHAPEAQAAVRRNLEGVLTPVTGLAYLLTPAHAARGFFFGGDGDKSEFADAAAELAGRRKPALVEAVEEEVAAYVAEMATLPDTQRETVLRMSAREFWKVVGRQKYPALFEVAKPVCELPAAAEESSAVLRLLPGRLRSRLANERVKKLLFVYANCALLDPVDKSDYLVEEGEGHEVLKSERHSDDFELF